MKLFSKYVAGLEQLAQSVLIDPKAAGRHQTQIHSALNGGPARVLRESLSIEKRREYGCFFTGETLVDMMKAKLTSEYTPGRYIDPACGSGNLLLLASSLLPIGEDLDSTLDIWGDGIVGYELRPEFTRVAKARLALQAALNVTNKTVSRRSLQNLFPNVRTANGLGSDVNVESNSRILMNPPFFRMNAPKGCTWGSGRVSAAAVFLSQFLERATPGTEIVAILPDVLRSGSLYEKWRRTVTSHSRLESIQLYGQFDATTDINVFVAKFLVGEAAASNETMWLQPQNTMTTVGDLFDVSVGAVVPFRNKDEGRVVSYVHSKGLSKWCIVEPHENRGFDGTVVKSPFVVIRRTSRIEDGHRAVATIIKSSNEVAVENHLIVLKPKDKTIQTCKKLIEILKSVETDCWLNQRIRCRHLTTSSVKEIPWNKSV